MAAAAAAAAVAAVTASHPDQLVCNYEAREARYFLQHVRKEEGGRRAMDVARDVAARNSVLPIWAVDIPNPENEPGRVGVKSFFVASYPGFMDYYRGLDPADRRVYEIARVLPTRMYIDLDVERAENTDMTDAVFREKRDTLVTAVHAELAVLAELDTEAVSNQEGNIGELVIVDSTRPSKISQHLVFPNAVLRNPFHCGALIRKVRHRLMQDCETSSGNGDKDNDHPFFIWNRNRDRANPGHTIRVRNFFADLKVYTFDRNFRVVGSRKNFRGALPLHEEGNVDGVLNWSILSKTILQRVTPSLPVLDCQELDGSMPVSTNDDNYLRYDIENSALAGRLTKSTTSASASAAAAAHVPSTQLQSFWGDVYPFDILWAMTGSTAKREFRFVNSRGMWTKGRSFLTVAAFKHAVMDALPSQIHVGPVQGDVLVNPTLTFDVDINEYARYRPCCGDTGKACATCWPILVFAQHAIKAYCEEMGIGTPLFFFSGSKGVHAWLPPSAQKAEAIARTPHARVALLSDFASFYNPPTSTPVSEDRLPPYSAGVVRACVATTIAGAHAYWTRFLRETMKLSAPFDRHARVHGEVSAIVHYMWPRLDEAVTRDPDHKIKAPFCIHPRTQRCARWLPDPSSDPYNDAHFDDDIEKCIQELRLRIGL